MPYLNVVEIADQAPATVGPEPSTVKSAQAGCPFQWLDQRFRGERLCEIGKATGPKGSFANVWVVVPCHEDNWH